VAAQGQAREAAASAKGRTQRAKNIANRISKVQAFETKVEASGCGLPGWLDVRTDRHKLSA